MITRLFLFAALHLLSGLDSRAQPMEPGNDWSTFAGAREIKMHTWTEDGGTYALIRLNRQGALLEELNYFDERLDERITNSYDSSGRLSERAMQSGLRSGSPRRMKSFFQYQHNSYEELLYDDMSGRLWEKILWFQDAKGRVVLEESYKLYEYEEDKMKPHRTVNKYDEKGNKVETISYTGDGNIWHVCSLAYDHHNNPVKYSILDRDGTVKWTISYSYTYNEKGHWTQRREQSNRHPNGVKREVTTKLEITYY